MADISADEEKIQELLTRTVEEVIDFEHLKKRLLKGEKLRVKLGIDPTADILHLGHSIPIRKLKQFQESGHQVIFLIGDFTAKIGDPSGRMASRPRLSEREIKNNMKNYLKLAGRILDMKKVEVRFNREWYDKKKADFMMELLSKFTYGQLRARNEFKERVKKGIDFTLEEMIYPLLQGYDSVALKNDVEIGGTDQKFNLVMARRVQKKFGLAEQDIMTLTLLEGTDGERKMSKSYGNYIALDEKPEQMFGKIMAIPDTLVWRYFTLLTDVPVLEIEEMRTALPGAMSMLEIKKRLAFEITKMYHGLKNAEAAREEFNRVFKEGGVPQNIPEFELKGERMNIVDLLLKTGFAPSASEAKRLIEQKAVRVGEEVVDDWHKEIELFDGLVINLGPRRFAKIRKQPRH